MQPVSMRYTRGVWYAKMKVLRLESEIGLQSTKYILRFCIILISSLLIVIAFIGSQELPSSRIYLLPECTP